MESLGDAGFRLDGLIAIVTGSSSGIGRAISRTLGLAGAAIVCCDIRKSARAEGYESDIEVDTDDAIRAMGGTSVFVKTDASNSDDVRAAIRAGVEHFGHVDIIVNNAGIWTGPHTIIEETEEEYDRTMAVNCKGVWLGCKYAIDQMLRQGTGGRIVNISSAAALVGLEKEPAYCASKGAVAALTRQLALDFASDGIGVNAICPGFVTTGLARAVMGKSHEHGLTPWPRLGEPTDVAHAALFLASRSAEWITGAVLTVDGGYVAR